MRFLKKYFDFAILAFVIGGFVSVAAQRLATTPLPDTDESMMLQISYEMLNHGKLAFPMKRFYGGNIENAWHSLTPVAFVTLSGFLKLFGWGLTQGRVYNLITAVLMLLMLYLLARKLFSWQVGLTAVVLIVSDPLFMARSRLLRYDLHRGGVRAAGVLSLRKSGRERRQVVLRRLRFGRRRGSNVTHERAVHPRGDRSAHALQGSMEAIQKRKAVPIRGGSSCGDGLRDRVCAC